MSAKQFHADRYHSSVGAWVTDRINRNAIRESSAITAANQIRTISAGLGIADPTELARDAAFQYARTHRISTGTQRSYDATVRAFVAWVELGCQSFNAPRPALYNDVTDADVIRWLEDIEIRLSSGTVQRYRRNLLAILATIPADTPARKLTSSHFKRFINRADDVSVARTGTKLVGGTIKAYINTLASFFGFLESEAREAGEKLPASPVARLRDDFRTVIGEREGRRGQSIERHRLEFLLAAAMADSGSPDPQTAELGRMVLTVMLTLCTMGLRIEEAREALRTPTLVDTEDGPCLVLFKTKGGERRAVGRQLLSEAVKDRLATYRRGEHIIPPSWPVNYLRDALNVWAARQGVHLTPHMLRHWFCTDAYYSLGNDIKAAQVLMRHASTESTMGYIHVPRQVMDKAASLGSTLLPVQRPVPDVETAHAPF